MTIGSGTREEAVGLLALQDRIVAEGAREAFAYLHLGFARLHGCECEVEAHGEVSSLRIRDDGEWSYSLATAQNWVLAYVRPPEVRKGRLTFEQFQQALPQAMDRGDGHFKARLQSLEDAAAFLTVVRGSRGDSTPLVGRTEAQDVTS